MPRKSQYRDDTAAKNHFAHLLCASKMIPETIIKNGGKRAVVLGGHHDQTNAVMVRCLCGVSTEHEKNESPVYTLETWLEHSTGEELDPEAEDINEIGLSMPMVEQHLGVEVEDSVSLLDFCKQAAIKFGGAELIGRPVLIYWVSQEHTLQTTESLGKTWYKGTFTENQGTWFIAEISGYDTGTGALHIKYAMDGGFDKILLPLTLMHWGSEPPPHSARSFGLIQPLPSQGPKKKKRKRVSLNDLASPEVADKNDGEDPGPSGVQASDTQQQSHQQTECEDEGAEQSSGEDFKHDEHTPKQKKVEMEKKKQEKKRKKDPETPSSRAEPSISRTALSGSQADPGSSKEQPGSAWLPLRILPVKKKNKGKTKLEQQKESALQQPRSDDKNKKVHDVYKVDKKEEEQKKEKKEQVLNKGELEVEKSSRQLKQVLQVEKMAQEQARKKGRLQDQKEETVQNPKKGQMQGQKKEHPQEQEQLQEPKRKPAQQEPKEEQEEVEHEEQKPDQQLQQQISGPAHLMTASLAHMVQDLVQGTTPLKPPGRVSSPKQGLSLLGHSPHTSAHPASQNTAKTENQRLPSKSSMETGMQVAPPRLAFLPPMQAPIDPAKTHREKRNVQIDRCGKISGVSFHDMRPSLAYVPLLTENFLSPDHEDPNNQIQLVLEIGTPRVASRMVPQASGMPSRENSSTAKEANPASGQLSHNLGRAMLPGLPKGKSSYKSMHLVFDTLKAIQAKFESCSDEACSPLTMLQHRKAHRKIGFVYKPTYANVADEPKPWSFQMSLVTPSQPVVQEAQIPGALAENPSVPLPRFYSDRNPSKYQRYSFSHGSCHVQLYMPGPNCAGDKQSEDMRMYVNVALDNALRYPNSLRMTASCSLQVGMCMADLLSCTDPQKASAEAERLRECMVECEALMESQAGVTAAKHT